MNFCLYYIVLAAHLLLGAGSSSASVQGVGPAPVKARIARIGNGSEPRELDPGKAVGVAEHNIISNLFEGLMTLDGLQDKPVAGVADHWEVSKDQLRYTFHLRAAAKWSDGVAVEAEDFVYAWQRMLTPAFAAEYAYQLFYLKNAQAFYEGKLKDFNRVGVRAIDVRTLQVDLEQPTPYFLDLASRSMLAPVPRHLLQSLAAEVDWTQPGVMVSNGPFKLSEWTLNDHIKLIPNEHYWDHSQVALAAVEFYPIESQDSADKAFFSGDLDYTDSVPSVKIPVYRARHLAHPEAYDPFHAPLFLATYFYLLNCAKPPLNDARVRLALSLAIDRSLLTNRVLQGGELPATALTPPMIRSYYPQSPVGAGVDADDLARAKALLKAAGYGDLSTFPTLELSYNTDDNHKRLALALQQMWKKNLGINVTLFNQEWKVFQNSQRNRTFQISRYAWIGDYPDADTFLDLFISSGGNNNTGWSNPRYDALLKQAAATADPAARQQLLGAAETLLLSEMPIIPIYVYTDKHLVAERVHLRQSEGSLVPWHGTQTGEPMLKHWVLTSGD